jgi:hypothetical protein
MTGFITFRCGVSDYVAITYDPGIFGFVKAHRHTEGPALVMSAWEEEDYEWAAVFWVKRLHHAANPVDASLFRLQSSNTKAVERTYEILLSQGPPSAAYVEPNPDFQRKRVYDWEDDNIFPGHQPLTWRGCKNFLSRVWKDVGEGSEPSLAVSRKLNHPISFHGRICFPIHQKDYFWRRPVLLHEISHELKFEDKHGPEFVRTYIDLCVRYLGMERDSLLSSARRYGIVVATI